MEEITGKTRPAEIRVLKENAKYLMYKCVMKEKPAIELTLEGMHEEQPSWNVDSMIYGLKRLVEVTEKRKTLFNVYRHSECADDKPFILSVAGGAYTCVCSLVESFPTAARFNELGYNVFVLTYRVLQEQLCPKPLEDIAAAIRYIQNHLDIFEQKSKEYIMNGYSAGANAVVLWGTEEKGYGKYRISRPRALLPIYPCISSEYQDPQGKEWFLSMMFGKDYDMKTVKEKEQMHMDR